MKFCEYIGITAKDLNGRAAYIKNIRQDLTRLKAEMLDIKRDFNIKIFVPARTGKEELASE
ncbi:MAG: hypothetical protein AB1478_11620 [Nitrospirota bacterium]